MRSPIYGVVSFTEVDLEFLIEETSPQASNKQWLKELIQHDRDFRQAIVGDVRVFQRTMSDQEVYVKISPALYFEILLRKTAKELDVATHTLERIGTQSIPVFDTDDVATLLARSQVLEYLAHMLASFTRIDSYVRRVRVRRGIWNRVRYNDMDIDSLIKVSKDTDEENRLSLYKRIADVCLFVSSVFQEHTFYGSRSG